MYKSILLATVLFGGSMLSSFAYTDDREAIESLLKFPLLDAQVPQSQVEAFCEARVPVMPVVDSREEWERLTIWMDAIGEFYGTFDAAEQKRQLAGEAIAAPKE